MSFDDVYEKILPYLSDPQGIRKFLDGHKGRSIDELVEEINKLMVKANAPLKTDFRILLNALLKHY